jgi:hypothetical protein
MVYLVLLFAIFTLSTSFEKKKHMAISLPSPTDTCGYP